MAAPTFDTHGAVRKLRGAGIDEEAAEGVVEVVQEATSPLVTRDILRAELNRALWLQGVGVVVAISALATTAAVVAALIG